VLRPRTWFAEALRPESRRQQLRAAARVAAVVTLVIAVLYVAAAAAIELYMGRRVLWEVDQRLSDRLSVVSSLSDPLSGRTLPDDVGTDGEPIFVWWVAPAGTVTPLTLGAPPLPVGTADAVTVPVSISTGGAAYRFASARFREGVLVAAQNLKGPSHVVRVLLLGEVALGPVLLVAVFGGVLVISVRAAAPVESARRRQQELTADASHELRTPLTVIEAEIELALSGPPDRSADREALEHVGREGRRLRTIVEDLLWLARADAAPSPPAHVPTDLAVVAATGARRFEHVAGSRGIVVSSQLEPAWVAGAEEWLDRLTGTLLDNACRHARRGVRVRTLSEAGRALLRVEDDGPGIPPELRGVLFDRFRRATDVPGGAGLGLAIADSVVRGTSGRWRVGDSALGGALMEVSWRATRPHPAGAHEGTPRDGPTPAASGPRTAAARPGPDQQVGTASPAAEPHRR
jgi:signal transduction histidine kinase